MSVCPAVTDVAPTSPLTCGALHAPFDAGAITIPAILPIATLIKDAPEYSIAPLTPAPFRASFVDQTCVVGELPADCADAYRRQLLHHHSLTCLSDPPIPQATIAGRLRPPPAQESYAASCASARNCSVRNAVRLPPVNSRPSC